MTFKRFPVAAARSRSATLLCAAALGVAALVAAPRPAAAQVQNEQLLAQQRKLKADQFNSMKTLVRNQPLLEVKRIEDLFQLKVVNGRLEAEGPVIDPRPPAAKPDPAAKPAAAAARRTGQYRVELPNFPGPTMVHVSTAVQRVVGPAGQPAPKPVPAVNFSLQSYDLPDPDTLVTINVGSYASQFSISRNVQKGNGHASVQLTQIRDVGIPGAGMINFSVNEFGGNFNEQFNFNVQKPDMATLMRDNPSEVERYLRPLLAQLGQEQLFAPDTLVAWQVLNEYWQPDPAVAKQVDALLPALDDADYRAREKALAALIALGRPGAAVMLRLDRAGFTAATDRMVGRALSAYTQLPDREAARLRRDVAFLLDCQFIDDAEVRRAAHKHLLTVVKREKLAVDPDAPAADRSAAVRELRQELLGLKPAGSTTKPTTGPATGPTTNPTTAPSK